MQFDDLVLKVKIKIALNEHFGCLLYYFCIKYKTSDMRAKLLREVRKRYTVIQVDSDNGYPTGNPAIDSATRYLQNSYPYFIAIDNTKDWRSIAVRTKEVAMGVLIHWIRQDYGKYKTRVQSWFRYRKVWY